MSTHPEDGEALDALPRVELVNIAELLQADGDSAPGHACRAAGPSSGGSHHPPPPSMVDTMSWIKSTFCTDGTCVEATFVKSSHSSTGNCVEAAYTKSSESLGNGTCGEAANCACGHIGRILVRDSKNPDGPILSVDRDQWHAFLDGIRAGEFTEL